MGALPAVEEELPEDFWEELSDEHLVAVGRITVAAGRLEARLHDLAEAVIDPEPNVVRVLLGGAPFDAQVSTLVKVVDLKRPGGAWPAFRTWSEAAKAAMRERNKLLHGEWVVSFSKADGFVPAISTRSKRGPTDDDKVELHATAEQLEATAARLQALAREASALFDEMVEWGGSYYKDENGYWIPLWARGMLDGVAPHPAHVAVAEVISAAKTSARAPAKTFPSIARSSS